jgi:hypothetical protein
VARIVTWDGDLVEAHAPLSVTLVLNHELDVSRGDLIVAVDDPATVAKRVKAALVWMDQRPLDRHRRYLLKHTSHTVPAYVSAVEHRTNIGTLTHEPAETLEMNGIGVVSIQLLRPIALDLYGENRSTGAFILIDSESNSTVAAGMVTAVSNGTAEEATASLSERVTDDERAARWGHRGGVLELNGPADLVNAIERSLFLAGAITVRVDADDPAFATHAGLREILLRSNVASGLIALVVTSNEGDSLVVHVDEEQLSLDATDPENAISAVHQLLVRVGILLDSGKAGAL